MRDSIYLKQLVQRYKRLKRELSSVRAAAPTNVPHAQRLCNDLEAQRREFEELRAARRMEITHTQFGSTDFVVMTESMSLDAAVRPDPAAGVAGSGGASRKHIG